MTKLTLLTLLLLASMAAADPIDPDPDGIGVYFDLDGTQYCHWTSAPYEQVTAYLLFTLISSPDGVSGWEAYVRVEGATLAPAWALFTGLDVDDSFEGFQVGIGTAELALLPTEAVHVATFTALIPTTDDEIRFYISGVPGSTTFPDSPGYAGGMSAGDLRPLRVSVGPDPSIPVAGINIPECIPLGNEDRTFSEVKAFYR